ncbi:hypothetical protein chiPu_0013029 [Chiloscyllium punctatum]|uniref:IRG-type G domain-containing protein n=1 Tax=Chiloscyllium punctatum TaxID=137246 RepID=A0A401SVY3_CHIPU|nr:hypothetical protein [Chiloscyllium punctatum]
MALFSNSSYFSQQELDELNGGLEMVTPLIQKKLDDLDNSELNIAVTGETGSGKSTFINVMRGLRDGDKGAAKTGTTETTMEPTSYSHPNLPNVYCRFRENDVKLAKEFKRLGKKFYFIRSKIDNDCCALRKQRSDGNEEAELKKIRKSILESIIVMVTVCQRKEEMK